MDQLKGLLILLVAAQLCISTVRSQGPPTSALPTVPLESRLVGFYVADETTETIYCPVTAEFASDATFDSFPGTYAYCKTAGQQWAAGTSCQGTEVYYKARFTTGGGGYFYDSSRDWTCITVTLYESYNGGAGSGSQYLINCQDSIGIDNDSIETLFLEHPPTSSATPTDASTPTARSRPSEPTATAESEDETSIRTNAGVIAGAVVGSVVAVCLIVGGIALGFRLGRRSQRDTEDPTTPKTFVATVRSLPRPTITKPSITWTNPSSNAPAPIIQPVAVENKTEVKGDEPDVQQAASPVSQFQAGPSIQGAEFPTGANSQDLPGTDVYHQSYVMDSTIYRPPGT